MRPFGRTPNPRPVETERATLDPKLRWRDETVVDEQKPPPGLRAAGRALWRQIARACVQDDLELTAQEQIWLASRPN
jgi:hypothetical protein